MLNDFICINIGKENLFKDVMYELKEFVGNRDVLTWGYDYGVFLETLKMYNMEENKRLKRINKELVAKNKKIAKETNIEKEKNKIILEGLYQDWEDMENI